MRGQCTPMSEKVNKVERQRGPYGVSTTQRYPDQSARPEVKLWAGTEAMDAFKYSDLLHHLEEFDPWLIGLGITPHPNDRIHQAFKVLSRAEVASRQGREARRYSYIRPEDWFLIIEALEAYEVFSAFRNDPSPAVAASLRRALSGPIKAADENQRNRDGRNIWYELALAASWKLRGAEVSMDEPDLRLIRDGLTFLVACKRPSNEKSVGPNLRNAIKQLRQNLDNKPLNTYGVATISLSCVFNPGDEVFSGEVVALGELVRHELDKHREYLRSVHDPRLCFAIFELTTPSVGGEDVDLVRASYSVGVALNDGSFASRAFHQHAQEMCGYPKR